MSNYIKINTGVYVVNNVRAFKAAYEDYCIEEVCVPSAEIKFDKVNFPALVTLIDNKCSAVAMAVLTGVSRSIRTRDFTERAVVHPKSLPENLFLKENELPAATDSPVSAIRLDADGSVVLDLNQLCYIDNPFQFFDLVDIYIDGFVMEYADSSTPDCLPLITHSLVCYANVNKARPKLSRTPKDNGVRHPFQVVWEGDKLFISAQPAQVITPRSTINYKPTGVEIEVVLANRQANYHPVSGTKLSTPVHIGTITDDRVWYYDPVTGAERSLYETTNDPYGALTYGGKV